MKGFKIFKIALQSIMKNRMRSLLTSLGIIIGVCSVIVMVAIGEGSQANIEKNIASMGTNLIMVRRPSSRDKNVSAGGASRNTLTLDDIEYLRKNSSDLIIGVSASVRTSAQVIAGTNNWKTTVEGVGEDYPIIKSWEMENGNFFTEKESKLKKKVAVLGQTVATELFGEDDPLGKSIRVNKLPFKIIGVLKSKGQDGRGEDQDDIILIPTETAMKKMAGSRYINMMFISAATMDVIDQAQEEVTELLRASHKLRYGEDDDFMIFNQSEITEMASSTSKTLTMLLGAIAGVSLIVGGIGIMNIMLVSVTERTREIGIRLSIGARSRDVMTQFLTEAVTLSLAGGMIGIIFAVIITTAINNLSPLNALLNPSVILIAFSFSGAVGVFFGYYPAKKAASMNPIDALRYE
jgi:putative ABC transport system permease protein